MLFQLKKYRLEFLLVVIVSMPESVSFRLLNSLNIFDKNSSSIIDDSVLVSYGSENDSLKKIMRKKS